MKLQSILRHWFTLAATLLTGWLVLPTEQQAELTKAFGDLVGPVAIILTLIVTAGWRLALAWISSIFRHGGGETSGGSGGRLPLAVVLCMGLGISGFSLVSCTSDQLAAARAIPIKACVQTDSGLVCYSSKSGLSAEIDACSGK